MQKTRHFRYWIEFRFKLIKFHFMIDVDSTFAIKNVWTSEFYIWTFFYESDGNWKKNWLLLNGFKKFLPTYLPIFPICINIYVKDRKKKDIGKIFWCNSFFIKLFTYLPTYVCSECSNVANAIYCNLKVTCLRKTKTNVLVFYTKMPLCLYFVNSFLISSRSWEFVQTRSIYAV